MRQWEEIAKLSSVTDRPPVARARRRWCRRNVWEIRFGQELARKYERSREIGEALKVAERTDWDRQRAEAAELLMFAESVWRTETDSVN